MQVAACKHLSFDQDRYTANLAYIQGDKVVWERHDPSGQLQLCQFCTFRGRINNPLGCLSQGAAQCSDYEEHVHEIEPPRNP